MYVYCQKAITDLIARNTELGMMIRIGEIEKEMKVLGSKKWTKAMKPSFRYM